MADSTQTLGQRIKSAHKKLCYSQETLSFSLHVNRVFLGMWEREIRPVPKKYFSKLSNILEIPLKDIEVLAAKWTPSKKKNAVIGKKDELEGKNILSIIIAIADISNIETVIITDLRFLLEEQERLPDPMSRELVRELLNNLRSVK